ncbi:hypothetical protein BS17DRAFT_763846 [Gyrodon lividus]|nr:hypothetical protein BS17DRAFT_763846 [Gyrodon lividus]
MALQGITLIQIGIPLTGLKLKIQMKKAGEQMSQMAMDLLVIRQNIVQLSDLRLNNFLLNFQLWILIHVVVTLKIIQCLCTLFSFFLTPPEQGSAEGEVRVPVGTVRAEGPDRGEGGPDGGEPDGAVEPDSRAVGPDSGVGGTVEAGRMV